MDMLRVLRIVLVCAQCLAIAACSWVIGVMTERYGDGPARAPGTVLVLFVAVLANTDNLAVVTASEHMRIHRAQSRERYRAPLTEDAVREALEQGGLKHAARVLGVHTQTLRNRFPDLVAPHKRKSPTNIDDPQIVETIRRLAPDPTVGYRQIAEHYGIAAMTVVRLCQRHGIAWVKQTRKGEKRRPYRRRGPRPT